MYTQSSFVWQTSTNGKGTNAKLVMQNDGNLVLLSSIGPTWWTGKYQDIIFRARTWLNPSIPYSQSAYHNGYRTDCSGYASMSWNLGTSATTWSLPNYSHQIAKDDLWPGDILLNINEHVLIFEKWANSERTKYWAFEQTPPQVVYHMIDYPYWIGYNEQAYLPYRLNGRVEAETHPNE